MSNVYDLGHWTWNNEKVNNVDDCPAKRNIAVFQISMFMSWPQIMTANKPMYCSYLMSPLCCTSDLALGTGQKPGKLSKNWVQDGLSGWQKYLFQNDVAQLFMPKLFNCGHVIARSMVLRDNDISQYQGQKSGWRQHFIMYKSPLILIVFVAGVTWTIGWWLWLQRS